MMWIVPWFIMIQGGDLTRKPVVDDASAPPDQTPKLWDADFSRMLGALVVVVITINLTWQYFRVWLPNEPSAHAM